MTAEELILGLEALLEAQCYIKADCLISYRSESTQTKEQLWNCLYMRVLLWVVKMFLTLK